MANPFDFAHTAMLAMQLPSRYRVSPCKATRGIIERAARLLKAARKVGMPVIHSQVVFRPGWPEVSSRNKLFASIKSSPQHRQWFEGAAGAIHHQFAVGEGFVLVVDEWESPQQFEQFFSSPEIAAIIRDMGGSGPPEITIGEALASPDQF